MEGLLTDLVYSNLFSSLHFLALLYATRQHALLDKMFWAELNEKWERGREWGREGACKVLEDLEEFLWGEKQQRKVPGNQVLISRTTISLTPVSCDHYPELRGKRLISTTFISTNSNKKAA